MALAPGNYKVTVAVGWPGRPRDNDVEYIQINTVVLRNYTCSGDCTSVREYSADIVVHPHSNGGTLVMTVGSPFIDQYTILNYLKIEATGATTSSQSQASGATTSSQSQATGQTTTTSTTFNSATSSLSLSLFGVLILFGFVFF